MGSWSYMSLSIRSQPRGLWVLSFGKLWDTFSYFGTQTILALYFIHIFHLTRTDSYLLYGAYAAFAFSTPVIGGIVADKFIGSKNALLLGGILVILGNLFLVSLDRYWFCLGLATTIIGSGLYKSTSSHLVGSLYEVGDPNKEAGFTWFYLAINLGGALGPLIYGFVVYAVGWNYGFLCSAFGISLGLVWLYSQKKIFEANFNTQGPRNNKSKYAVLLTLLTCVLLSVPFYFPKILNLVIGLMFAGCIAYLIIAINQYREGDRRKLYALLLLSFLGMFYFAAGMQIGTTITLFIQHAIKAGEIDTRLPASTFSSLYSLFVILLAPVISYIWKVLKAKGISYSPSAKLAIGTFLATIGISSFALASLTGLIFVGIVIGNLLLSAGELVLTPSIYTGISDVSPSGMKNSMMGCWFLFVALGGYASSILADASHTIAPLLPYAKVAYFGEFVFIAGFTLLIAIAIALITPKITKLMK